MKRISLTLILFYIHLVQIAQCKLFPILRNYNPSSTLSSKPLSLIATLSTSTLTSSSYQYQEYQAPQINPNTQNINIDHMGVSKNLPKGSIHLNIPNILSICRFCVIPFFVLSWMRNMKVVSTIIYASACFTDWIDGYLARKWNQVSAFGAFMDPVADKLMVTTALFMLILGNNEWWFVLPVAIGIGREIFVSALREWMAERGKRSVVKVGSMGKWKTITQMVSTTLLLLVNDDIVNVDFFDYGLVFSTSQSLMAAMGLLLFYVSTTLSLFSGFLYFIDAWPHLINN